jgi:transporter family protein
MSWLPFAVLSAVAGAVTAILAKLGVEGVPSTLAMAIRTIVVMVLAWILVISAGELRGFGALSQRTWTYLVASGLATGVSWWAYFQALQKAPASWVAPIDKLSLPLTVVLAAFWLHETVTWQMYIGIGMMVAGALLISM